MCRVVTGPYSQPGTEGQCPLRQVTALRFPYLVSPDGFQASRFYKIRYDPTGGVYGDTLWHLWLLGSPLSKNF